MRTGDILLFKGTGIFSSLIMAAPGSDYSHVGLFVDHPSFGPCVFESTSLGTLPDVMTQEKICGVQLVPAGPRIEGYDGEVFLRPLIGELSDEQSGAIMSFIDAYHGTPYEKDNLQLARAELDLFPWQANKVDNSSLFCSETAVMCLRQAGVLIDDGVPQNEFTPTDCSNDSLTTTNGFSYGDIVAL